MKMIDNYKNKLKSTLSEKRYKHSLGVCDEAVKLAEKYGADTEKAYKVKRLKRQARHAGRRDAFHLTMIAVLMTVLCLMI